MKNSIYFRDNYERQLFLFIVKFFSLEYNTRLYFEQYHTSHKKQRYNKYFHANNVIHAIPTIQN